MPAVGLLLASEYNETVAIDLHELEPGVWYLHIIDHFSAGSILTTKKSSEIVKHFYPWLDRCAWSTSINCSLTVGGRI